MKLQQKRTVFALCLAVKVNAITRCIVHNKRGSAQGIDRHWFVAQVCV